MDNNHFSPTDPVDAAAVFGVAGMLFALIVKVDFLSPEFFFLDLGCPGTSSWWTTSFLRSLSCTLEGHLTSGFWMLHARVIHTGNEYCLRGSVWFGSIWSALICSAFMINPFVLAKLILKGSPRHTFVQLTQVASRVDMVSQWIEWFRC